jgi:hypothetical protein
VTEPRDIESWGRQAAAFLDSEVGKHVLARLEDEFAEQWASGDAITVQAREELYGRVRAARLLKGQLQKLVDDMRVVQHRAQTQQKREQAI